MSQRWEISKVSTSKRVLEKIFTEVESPGILVFGADSCDGSMLKYDVCKALKVMTDQFSVPWTILSGEESCDHAKRHEAVMELRKRGAENVVGVYVKSDFVQADIDANPPSNFYHNLQVDRLLNNSPTPDGLAYLVTIS